MSDHTASTCGLNMSEDEEAAVASQQVSSTTVGVNLQ